VSELLADLWAVPTASRREVNELIERLEGRAGALECELAAERGAGRPFSAGVKDELAKTNAELDAAGQELRDAGRTENALSKLLDSRIRNVRDYLAGQAGPGEHVAGRTPEALADAADQDPGLLGQLIDAGERIPMVDVVAGAAGTALGTYTDVKAGKPLDEALPKEAAANVVGLVAGAVVGRAIGGIPGALVGSVVGYGVGDLTHNLLWEPWGQDMHTYGAVGGVLYGAGHSEFATVDDTRGFAVSAGHAAEHLCGTASSDGDSAHDQVIRPEYPESERVHIGPARRCRYGKRSLADGTRRTRVGLVGWLGEPEHSRTQLGPAIAPVTQGRRGVHQQQGGLPRP
jgi:hypothetical protein